MMELYSSLNSSIIFIFMILSVFVIIIQAMYITLIKKNIVLKIYEVLNIAYLILLSQMLRSLNSGLNSSILMEGIYDPFIWLIGFITITIGLYAYKTIQKNHIICGLLLVVITFPIMERLPYKTYTFFFVISLFGLGIRGYLLYKKENRKVRTEITYNSIKEAMDAHFIGILFAETNGEITLINNKMAILIKKITGEYKRNANKFWDFILEESSDSICCRQEKDCYIMTDTEGEKWQFRRETIFRKKKEIYQIIATNVTEQEAINQKLKQKKKQLEEQGYELKALIENVEEIERLKAYSIAYEHIHDMLGQKISILQRMLKSDENLQLEKLEELIDNLVKDINSVEERSSEEIYQNLVESFKSLDIQIHKNGEVPQDPKISNILVGIVREGITNAVRHGRAKNIYIDLYEDKDHYLSIRNDGAVSPEIIYWGNGLKSIENKAKELNGILNIDTRPEFKLTIKY